MTDSGIHIMFEDRAETLGKTLLENDRNFNIFKAVSLGSHKRKEILGQIGVKDHPQNTKRYIKPLVDQKILVEKTIPLRDGKRGIKGIHELGKKPGHPEKVWELNMELFSSIISSVHHFRVDNKYPQIINDFKNAYELDSVRTFLSNTMKEPPEKLLKKMFYSVKQEYRPQVYDEKYIFMQLFYLIPGCLIRYYLEKKREKILIKFEVKGNKEKLAAFVGTDVETLYKFMTLIRLPDVSSRTLFKSTDPLLKEFMDNFKPCEGEEKEALRMGRVFLSYYLQDHCASKYAFRSFFKNQEVKKSIDENKTINIIPAYEPSFGAI